MSSYAVMRSFLSLYGNDTHFETAKPNRKRSSRPLEIDRPADPFFSLYGDDVRFIRMPIPGQKLTKQEQIYDLQDRIDELRSDIDGIDGRVGHMEHYVLPAARAVDRVNGIAHAVGNAAYETGRFAYHTGIGAVKGVIGAHLFLSTYDGSSKWSSTERVAALTTTVGTWLLYATVPEAHPYILALTNGADCACKTAVKVASAVLQGAYELCNLNSE